MKYNRIIFCILLFVCFISIFVIPCFAEREYIRIDGYKRFYTVYAPEDIQENTIHPLIVLLHGGGGNIKLLMNQFGNRLVKLATSDGAIVVVPEALERAWNDGRDYPKLYIDKKKPNDIKFIRKLLKTLKLKYPIDSKKIYVTGPSTGGTMTYRIMLEMEGEICAAAAIIANLPENLYKKYKNYKLNKSIPLLIMNGTDDPLMPWDGGAVKTPGRQKRDYVISTDKTVEFWIKKNKCTKKPKKYRVKNTNPKDGTVTEKYVYNKKKSNIKIVLYKIIGGGHHFPSKEKSSKLFERRLMIKILGKKPKDFNAADRIWKFFKSY